MVDDDLGDGERRLKVAEVVRTIKRPEGTGSHAVIAHLIGDLFVLRGDGDEDTGRNAVDVLDDMVLVEDASVLLEPKDLIEVGAAILRRGGRTVSADDIGNKSGRVRHRGHLDHGLRTVLERGEHTRAHLAARRLLEHGVGVAVIVKLVVLALAHDDNFHAHRTRKGEELHNGARLIARRARVDDAVLVAELLQIAADDNIRLHIHHDNVLLVVHRIDRDLDADLGHARHIDRNFDEVRLRDEIRVLRRNVFALLHIAVRFLERLCDSDVLVADACIVEGVDDVFKFDVRDDRGHDALHKRHLRDHAASHLTRTDDARADDFTLFLALGEFLVHIQHCETPFAHPSVELLMIDLCLV